MITSEVFLLAQQLWDYHHMNHHLEKSDCILALGSHDLRVAERAAEIFLQEWAPLIVMSGGLGNFTQSKWTIAEADQFAAIAVKKGVPPEVILIENQSTNTGENILFTQKLLEQKGLDLKSFILVQKPYMERRSYATFKKHWPGKKLIVTSPQISFDQYSINEDFLEQEINIMTGDLQRIKLYPAKGFQIYQEIPEKIWDVYERLIDLGFNKHLVKD